MIITSTPLRISLGGGGTDAPSFYAHRPGFVLSAAIDKYVYIAINATFTPDYLLKYSAMERVERIDQVQHRIMAEALTLLDIEPGVEIVSLADIPSGTGLGSSGSFTVGLLRALHAFRHRHIDPGALAELACHIEIDLLGEPVGKQDQYIASFGGLTAFEFHGDGRVDARRLDVSGTTLHALEDRLLLFFTGYSRAASSVLQDQKDRSQRNDETMLDNLSETLEIGRRITKALEDGEVDDFGRMMHEHWEVKRARTEGISNGAIDGWYDLGRAHGAIGGKLVGAGAGGFLLFLADDPERLRAAMTTAGLPEVRFGFDQDGSSVIVRG
jgi:D-glycero-alpha-D-manno-heptose-7-phosphate kinase